MSAKKQLIIFVILLLTSNVFALPKAIPKKASEAAVTLSNEFIEAVIEVNGQFTVGTVKGDPDRRSDDSKDLLYGHPNPGTSDTMISVDGVTGTLNRTAASGPALNGSSAACSWLLASNIEVIQTLSIVNAKSTFNEDTILIKYKMTNNDTLSHNVALRLQLDTLLGSNDGAPFRITDVGEVTTDMEWDNDAATASTGDIPQFCHVFDNLANPTVFSMITLRDFGYRVPDRFVLGYWPSSVGSWDYTIDPNRSFLDYNQDGTITGSSPDSDSSAIVWWGYPGTPISLASGASVEVAIMYGISNMTFRNWDPLNIGLTSPVKIETSAAGGKFIYNPDPIIVTAYMKNISSGAVTGADITINLPQEFMLDAGETATKAIEESAGLGYVSAGKESQASWSIRSNMRYVGDRKLTVTARVGNRSVSLSRTIRMPGIANAIYGQLTDSSKNPVAGAAVAVLRSGAVLYQMTTDANGYYAFSDVPEGVYDVRFTAAGYPVVTMQAAVSLASQSTNGLLAPASVSAFEVFPYPNPVKEGSSHIRFFSSDARDITIKIYNSAGELVKTEKASCAAGLWQEVLWNIDNAANGVYIYKIDGAGSDIHGKIMVLKRKSF